MTIGVFLAIGESLNDFKRKGQLKRLTDYNLKKYAQAFDKVYVFTYSDERNFRLPKNCKLITNSGNLHRYIYSLLMPIVKRRQIQECHVLRGFQITGGIPAVVSKILYGKKYVINYGYDYAAIASIEGKPIQSLVFKLIEFPIIKFADAIIATSEQIRKALVREIGSKKTYLFPNGVDTKLFKEKRKNINTKLTVMYIGRLEKQKNLTSLIEAVKDLKNVRLIFFGDGSQKKYLLASAREKSVELEIKNPIPWEQIPEALSTADIFALPSLKEGNPKILLEAMSCAKAVIGSKVSGISELIKDHENGLLTTIDPNSIKEAIKRLQNHKLRLKLGFNARKYIVENYEVFNLLEKETNLLKRIASRG